MRLTQVACGLFACLPSAAIAADLTTPQTISGGDVTFTDNITVPTGTALTLSGGARVVSTGSIVSNDPAVGFAVVVNSQSTFLNYGYAEAETGIGSEGTIINHGVISGIFGVESAGRLVNFGTISGNIYGVFTNLTGSVVENYGLITGSTAVYFSAAGNTLILGKGAELSGSVVDINLGPGNAVVVDGATGSFSYVGTLSSLTATGSSLATATGTDIVAIDAGNLTNASATLGQRGVAMSSMIDRASRQGPTPATRVAGPANDLPAAPKWTAWGMGYGEKSQRGSDEDPSYSDVLWGGAVGLDRHLDDDMTVGIFVGRDENRSWYDDRSVRTVSKNVYVGLRAGQDPDAGMFWNAAAHLGSGDISTRREDGSVGGPSRASTDAVFGGVSATLGNHWVLGDGWGATVRGRGFYSAQNTEGYTETISGIDLEVGDRVSQVIGGRLETGLDFWGRERGWQVSPRVGVEGWRAVGEDSTEARFGAMSRRIADDDISALGVVTGVDLSYRIDAVTLSAMIEGRRNRDGATATEGNLQVSLAF